MAAKVKWWTDLAPSLYRRMLPDYIRSSLCMDTGPPARKEGPTSAFTLAKLEAAVAELKANAPPECRLLVHSMLEARILTEAMGVTGLSDHAHLTLVDSFMGIPIKATDSVPSGTAIFMVDSDPPRVYVVKVPR